jgi:alanine racemase
MTARVWAEIDVAAIKSNLAAIRSFNGPQTDVMAVVKANAYGHGLEIVANAAWESGTRWFGVATVSEGVEVRYLLPESWVCLFPPFCPGEEAEIVRSDLIPLISSQEQAERLSVANDSQREPLSVHLEVDTGMGRSGILPSGALALAQSIAQNPRLMLGGIATHFAAGDTDPSFTRRQADELNKVVGLLSGEGIDPGVIHAANSGGMILASESRFNLVRPGLLMYGILPIALNETLIPDLSPALVLKTCVSLIRDLPKGHSISYGRTHQLSRDSRVATLPVGYGDGYPRDLSNQGAALISGQRAPILGRVCMDITVVDITDIPGVSEGDEAVLIGAQGNYRIRTEDIARLIGTTEHDVTTRLTERVPRIPVNAT